LRLVLAFRLALVAAVLVAPESAAWAGTLPDFDVAKFCRGDEQGEQPLAMLSQEQCSRIEGLAREEADWIARSSNKDAVQQCANTVSEQPERSYLALFSCLYAANKSEGGSASAEAVSKTPEPIQHVPVPTAIADANVSAPALANPGPPDDSSPSLGSAANAGPGGSPGSLDMAPTGSVAATSRAGESSQPESSGESGAASPSHAFAFTRDLGLHAVHSEVKQLQIFLNRHGFPVAADGPGSAGKEVDNFGPSTKEALKKFQQAHAKELGIKEASGHFGASTRDYINGLPAE